MPGDRLHRSPLGKVANRHCSQSLTSSCAMIWLIDPIAQAYVRGLIERRRMTMRLIDTIYIDGQFVTPHGTELFDLHNPATEAVIGRVRLADEQDAFAAIAAAKAAFPTFSRTSAAERAALLRRMGDGVAPRRAALLAAIVEEYGPPSSRAIFMADHPANALREAADLLGEYA